MIEDYLLKMLGKYGKREMDKRESHCGLEEEISGIYIPGWRILRTACEFSLGPSGL